MRFPKTTKSWTNIKHNLPCVRLFVFARPSSSLHVPIIPLSQGCCGQEAGTDEVTRSMIVNLNRDG